MIATDTSGFIRYMNPAAERITDTMLTTVFGEPLEEAYSVSALADEPLWDRDQSAIRTTVPVGAGCFLLRTKDRIIPIESSTVPILHTGEVLGAATVFAEITERLRQEQKLQANCLRLQEMIRETDEALRISRAEIRALSKHLLTAQEEECRRIARELHDDLGQRTALIEITLGRLAHFMRLKESKRFAPCARTWLSWRPAFGTLRTGSIRQLSKSSFCALRCGNSSMNSMSPADLPILMIEKTPPLCSILS